MKYRVRVEDWTRFHYDVEAEDEREAEEKAMKLWEDGERDFDEGSVEAVSIEKLEK